MNAKELKPLWLAMILSLTASSPVFAQPRSIPGNATLSDQFGQESKIGLLSATKTLVVFYSAEREAALYLQAWYQGIKTRLPEDTVVLAVADLSAVPFFVPRNAIIRQLVSDYPGFSILLDWKGTLGSILALGKDRVSVTAYAAGRQRLQVAGEYSPALAERILAALQTGP